MGQLDELENIMLMLGVGENYPLPIPVHEGAAAQFLIKGGSILQICLPMPLPSELEQIKEGTINAGLIIDQPLILWVFRFGNITFECPYDVRLIKKDDLDLPEITNKLQRLSISMHLIEPDTRIIHALKYFTLSPQMTIRFLSAVQDQLVHHDADIMNTYKKYLSQSLETLEKIADMDVCGQ